MRKKNGTENLFVSLCVTIAIACFAGLLSLSLGGCMPPDEEPIPQALSEEDLIPDEDSASQKTSVLASEDDPDPDREERSFAAATSYRYDREKALRYAKRYALQPNINLAYCSTWNRIAADCTNFASQVLWQGGIPMQYGGGSQDKGWWYTKSCAWWGSSRSWRQVNELLRYLTLDSGIGEFRKTARELRAGDLIFYRIRSAHDGYSCDGNLFNHTTVVTGFDGAGEPLVSYHSNEALDVPWKNKTKSLGSLGNACAFAFVHIRD